MELSKTAQRSVSVASNGAAPSPAHASPWRFACPICRAALVPISEHHYRCPVDQTDFGHEDGIWRFLPQERAAYFQQFMQEYETVRDAEGRGSLDAAYYRALPFRDLSGRFAADWAIRAVSFQSLIDQVLRPIEQRGAGPLMVLDLGAGNGWLSYRLALRGHQAAAIDLTLSATDGLGTHVHYDAAFTPIQAEFDHLPFDSGQADLIIFNGSIHYAADLLATLREALRVLKPGGRLVIMDSPVYRQAGSGASMVQEREATFLRRFGFPSNAVPMENYLTHRRLEELAASTGLRWQLIRPDYGWRWALRPWRARIRRTREPAQFYVIVGQHSAQATSPGKPERIARHLFRRLLHLSLPWRKRGLRRVVLEHVAGATIVVLPHVFNPRLMRSGEFLARSLNRTLIPPKASVLDMGTGSGIGAVAAARWASRVVAVDINPEAVRCARINALVNQVEDQVDVRQGDLFAPLGDERFDVVLFNPPYYRGEPRDLLDYAWRSPDTVERFAAGLQTHLAPGGAALVVLSTDGETDAFLAAFRAHEFNIEVVAKRDLINEVLTIYRLTCAYECGPGSKGRKRDDHSV